MLLFLRPEAQFHLRRVERDGFLSKVDSETEALFPYVQAENCSRGNR